LAAVYTSAKLGLLQLEIKTDWGKRG